MKFIKRIILLLIIAVLILSCLLFTPPASTADSSPPVIRILYIGNSKTYYNIFPRMYRYLSKASGVADAKQKTVVAGGRTLQTHATKLEAIHNNKGKVLSYENVKDSFLHEDEYNAYLAAFDSDLKYVVLQAQKDEAKNYNQLYESSQRIINVLRKYGNSKIKVIYNAVWDQYPDITIYKTFDAQMAQFQIEQNKVNANYTQVAAKTGGTVSYSGQAVYNYLKTYSNKNVYSMYVDDLNHPTQAASYLSACCLFAAINNKTPVGIDYNGAVKDIEGNSIINLKYPASSSHNNENSTGRKELGDLNKTLVGKLQQTAHLTMINNSPTISSITPNITSWTNQNVTLTVVASDVAFGLDPSPYSWNNTNYSNSNIGIAAANGTYTIYVKNKIGKIASKSITINNIDKTAPTINAITPNISSFTNQNITLTVSASDSQSGINSYSWDGKNYSSVNTCVVSANGTYTAFVRDNVGNVASKSITINNIDKTAPTINALTPNISSTTNQNLTLTVSASDSQSGINSYSWDGKNYSNVNTYVVSANGTYTAFVRDNAGNVASKSITINNIDKTPPTLSLNYSTTEKTKNDVIVIIKSNEQLQALSGWSLSSDKLTLTKTYDKNTSGKETISVKDIIGNESKVTIEITNIEKPAIITSNKYILKNKTISNIKPNTTLTNIKNNISADKYYSIVNQNGAQIKETDIIATGYKIKFPDGEEYKLIVTGDLDGNGKITITDLVKTKKHIVGKEYLKDVYENAGDVNNDGKISVTDLAKSKRILVGLENL